MYSVLAIITYNEKDFIGSELVFDHQIVTPEQFIKEIT